MDDWLGEGMFNRHWGVLVIDDKIHVDGVTSGKRSLKRERWRVTDSQMSQKYLLARS